MGGRPAVFFDRDGIINQPPPDDIRYITRPEDFHLMPGFLEMLRLVRERNWPAIVVTNQKCIAIGRLAEEGLAAIHERMFQLLAQEGLKLDAVYHCPHDETANCVCRKPRPGMLLTAAAEHGIDLSRSWLVGDQPRDCEAANAAGCSSILVHASATSPYAQASFPDLFACAPFLREQLSAESP